MKGAAGDMRYVVNRAKRIVRKSKFGWYSSVMQADLTPAEEDVLEIWGICKGAVAYYVLCSASYF